MKTLFRRLFAVLLILSLSVSSASALSVDDALGLLEEHYVGNITDEAFLADTMDELFSSLGDLYTHYMDAEQYAAFLSSMDGGLGLVGIGVSVRLTENGILVTHVLPGSSAQSAGIAAGDLIVAIDETPCVPANESHQTLLSGVANTSVTLTLRRNDAFYVCTLLREAVTLPTVTFTYGEDGVGYIDCSSFGEDTGEQFRYGIINAHDRVNFWLLDLRSNPGGYSTSAISALGVLAGVGNYMFLRDKGGSLSYYNYANAANTDHPVVVLVDRDSASAAELAAAGIKGCGRGIVVGSRTYGKGVAQIILDQTTDPTLFNGDALKVTAYRFFSYDGNTTDHIGVIPTLMVDDESAEAVARSLSGVFREDHTTDGQLMLSISDQNFYIDLEDLTPATASALLSALPPQAKLYVGARTYYWDEITFDQAASLLNTTYESRWFDDVATSPYADEINALGTYSLLLGDGTGSFLPNAGLTRAQVCAMLAQLMNLSYDGPSLFSDVSGAAWYADEVNAMARLGLVKGVGNGKFQPNSVLSQQEFFTILGRMARYLNFRVDDYAYSFLDQYGNSTLHLYPELDGFADWAREETALLAWSAEALGRSGQIMLFDELTALAPTAPITRGEAAASLYRMLSCTGILDA